MPYLEIHNLDKHFGPTHAVRDVSFSLERGEVLALIGENGAGKSTLVKMLTGLYTPDAGGVRLEGRELALNNPQDAWRAGISAIHQETALFDELSVAENLFVGRHPVRGGFLGGMVDWTRLLERAQTLLERVDANFSPQTRLGDLSVAQKHLVQIARALEGDAGIVIMDEPTAALSRTEIEELYRVVRGLRAEGRSILLITHKFDEVFALADRYVVLRDGALVGEGTIADTHQDALISLMAGREVGQIFPQVSVEPGETVLEVRGLSHLLEFEDISFSVRRGEILGFYGLIGAGRSETMQALFGLTPGARGEVSLGGVQGRFSSPQAALRAGLVYVPEDRQGAGGIPAMSLLHNYTLPSLKKLLGGVFLRRAPEETLALEYARRLDLRAQHLDQPLSDLSGGNQQKVVIGKWLATQPQVIILDEPTKGIDVGAKAAVHRFMAELVEAGMAVILVSSELPEVLGMAHRTLVMREGRLVGEFPRGARPEDLVARAAGLLEGKPNTELAVSEVAVSEESVSNESVSKESV